MRLSDLNEAQEDTFISNLKGLKSWQVVIMNNYYRGKYSDYSGRYFYVLATSPEEARQVVLDNADSILKDLLAMKAHNGRSILPRSSAVRITADRIGEIKDGTEAGRMSTTSYRKMYSPQGVMMVKLTNGAIADVQGQEQGVAEGPAFDKWANDRAASQLHKLMSPEIKGKIQNIVSRLSDEYGMWDHEAQTFTPEGLEHLKSILKFNETYIKYALSLTSRDFEAEGVIEGDKKPHPKTWHDVDPKLGKQVDKMTQAEKVKKGLAHPDTLKKKGVEEANYSPMTKDSMKADKIKSLKNLIAIAKEQGRGVRAQELELELKKLQGVEEGLADDLAAFAAKHGGKVRHGPQPNKPMTAPTSAPQVQLSTQEREALAARLKELEARFDPNYQYSDDYSFHSEQRRIAAEIAGIKKKLGESIKGRSAIRQAMEAIDAGQRRAKQVPAEEMPKKTSPVLGQKEKQHPFKGRAVGGGL